MGLAMLAGAGASAGCGGDGSGGRAAVDAYVRQANAIQHAAAPAYKRANRAYVAFSRGKLPPARAVHRLAGARRAIAAARIRLAQLRPPVDARGLHARIDRYMNLNVSLARESERLAVYEQRAPRVLEPLAGIDGDLRSSLAAATTRDSQVHALDDFGDGLGGVIRRLDALDVPAVLAPTHRDQARRLKTTRALAGRLRDALLAQDAARVARLLVQFRRAGTAAPATGALGARAVKQYKRRFSRLNAAYAAVAREEIRLNRSLG
jgi:hypothetical protein